jgi:hypothetical protein
MQPQVQDNIQQMIKKLEYLSPERLAEVADFIDFLQQRDQSQRLLQDFIRVSEDAFAQVWDNDEDAVYDAL